MLYGFALWIVSDGDIRLAPVFFHRVLTSFEEMETYAKKQIAMAEKNPKFTSEVLSSIIVVPLRFERVFPLKKEYWLESKGKENPLNRIKNFAEAIKEFNTHEAMIGPEISKEETIFNAVFTIKKDSSKKVIEDNIYNSDVHVATEAKQAAFYSIEPTYGYELETGEVVGYKATN